MELPGVLRVVVAVIAMACCTLPPTRAEDVSGERATAQTEPPASTSQRPKLDCTWSEALAELLWKVDELTRRVDAISNRLDRLALTDGDVKMLHEFLDSIRFEPVVEVTLIGGKPVQKRKILE